MVRTSGLIINIEGWSSLMKCFPYTNLKNMGIATLIQNSINPLTLINLFINCDSSPESYLLQKLSSFKVRLSAFIIKGALRLGIFVIVFDNPSSKVAWRCQGSNPNTQIPSLIPWLIGHLDTMIYQNKSSNFWKNIMMDKTFFMQISIP